MIHKTYWKTLLPTCQRKVPKKRRPYPTRYTLKIREKVRDKVRAIIESAIKKTFHDSVVVLEDVECDCGNCIDYPGTTS